MKSLALKRGDTSPALRYALLPASVILTGATVVFNMRPEGGGAAKVSRASAVIEVATGTPTVRYNWMPADTDTDGSFEAEFEVTYVDGTRETFPGEGFIPIVIKEDIA